MGELGVGGEAEDGACGHHSSASIGVAMQSLIKLRLINHVRIIIIISAGELYYIRSGGLP